MRRGGCGPDPRGPDPRLGRGEQQTNLVRLEHRRRPLVEARCLHQREWVPVEDFVADPLRVGLFEDRVDLAPG